MPPIDAELLNKVALGKEELLTAEQICKRLSISRSTFDRWIKNGNTEVSRIKAKISQKIGAIPGHNIEDMNYFPGPDLRIGQSQRWTLSTFRKWLTENSNSV